LIPVGVLVTVPVPLPARETVNKAEEVKLAVTAWLGVELIGTVHVELLPQPLADQLTKVKPVAGDSESTTCVPMPKLALHVPGQLISGCVDGVLVLVTRPGLELGGPEIVTPKTGRVKVAVIVGLVAPIVTVQVIAVVQPGAPVQL